MKWKNLAVENFLRHSLTNMPWQRKKTKQKNSRHSIAQTGSKFIKDLKISKRGQAFTHLFYKNPNQTIGQMAKEYGLSRQRIHQHINIARHKASEKIVQILMQSLVKKGLQKPLHPQCPNYTREICSLKQMLVSLPPTIFNYFLQQRLIEKILTQKLSYSELCYMVSVREEHEDNLLHLIYNVFDSMNIAQSIPAEFVIPNQRLIRRIRFLCHIPHNKIFTLGDIYNSYEEITLGHSIGCKKLSIINHALKQFRIK